MQFSFGSGSLWGERTDVTGSGIGPQQFGVLQEVQLNLNFSEKKLYGQFQFPQVIARAQGDITGTAKFAQILGLLFSDMFFGVVPTVGQFGVSQLEANTIPLMAPFSVLAANASAFNDDLGVVNAQTGIRFTRVTTAVASGQYSVNLVSGIYTFSAQDAAVPVLLSYSYNVTTSGNKLALTNQLMGVTPVFKMTLFSTFKGKGTSLRLNACTSSKLTLPTKFDDWTIQNMEFTAFADVSGNIGTLSTVE